MIFKLLELSWCGVCAVAETVALVVSVVDVVLVALGLDFNGAGSGA